MKKSLILILLFMFAWQMSAFGEQKSDYKLQPTDVISITVHKQPDLTTMGRVTSDGYITFPLLGKVHVQDMTIYDVEQKLKGLLEKEYLVTAQLIVFI